MHILLKLLPPALGLVLVLAACAPAGGTLTQSTQTRDRQPAVPDADLASVVAGSNAFAFDLYRQVAADPGNLFFSPYSLTSALAMTSAGAAGDTASQMAAVLHFSLPPARLHPALNRLDLELASHAQGQAFSLHSANALWGQQGFAFQPAFLETLAVDYAAGMHLVDFRSDPQAARAAINAWVSQQTQQRIQDLVPPGAVDPLTRLVLANAIYFKADWAEPFTPEATRDQPFTLLDGSQESVATMFQQSSFRYAEIGARAQLLELPYAGNDLSLLVILPAPGQFDALQADLGAGRLNVAADSLSSREVQVWLPKFHFEYALALNPNLAALGMTDAFDPNKADFSGMDGQRDLYIGSVLHKAYVAVDEQGTEAAAASAVGMQSLAMPVASPVEFKADRPFFFLIRDNPTGTVLFLGRVIDPGK